MHKTLRDAVMEHLQLRHRSVLVKVLHIKQHTWSFRSILPWDTNKKKNTLRNEQLYWS